jgi:predicted nucleic acid-binding protein
MAKTNDSYLIADTSGLVSLTVKTDRNHAPAVTATEALQGKESNILVPYEILVETVNVLGKRLGHEPALAVASYISETPLFLILDSSKHARAQALQRFATQPQAVSFTDCIVMAVADEYGTKAVFGFDADHARNGYVILNQEPHNRG